MRKSVGVMLCLGGLGLWAGARAQNILGAPATPTTQAAKTLRAIDPRWQPSLDAFAAADRLNAPQPGGVLFVGSSSIRLWDGLEQQFAGLGQMAAAATATATTATAAATNSAPAHPAIPVLKRGFGGSRLADCAHHVAELVLPYKPRLVVVYAGDNDLAEGRTPEQVLESFKAFVEGVQRGLPETRIAYLSIKPSPLRASLLPSVRAANALIERYAESVPALDFIDIYTPMLSADGMPRAELFRADALHLNDAGYALWKTVISPHLAASFESSPLAPSSAAPRVASPLPTPAAVGESRAPLHAGP